MFSGYDTPGFEDWLAPAGLRHCVRIACRGVLRGGLRLRHDSAARPFEPERIMPTKETAGAATSAYLGCASSAPSCGSSVWGQCTNTNMKLPLRIKSAAALATFVAVALSPVQGPLLAQTTPAAPAPPSARGEPVVKLEPVLVTADLWASPLEKIPATRPSSTSCSFNTCKPIRSAR